MSFEHKPDSGSLFKNDKKQRDTDADYNGSGLIDGKEYWLNLWIGQTKDGKRRLNLKLKPKQARQGGARNDMDF
jgi:hypothetical protein